MSKATPGPWEIAPYNDIEIRFIVDEDDLLIADCRPYIDPYYRNEKDRRYKNPKNPNEANARLIAAAPCLLEALQEVMSWIYDWDPDFTFENEWDGTEIKARAAIEKATGD